MKPSEMTNEELASFLEDVTWGEQKVDDSFVCEAAKRLRNVTVRSDNSAVIAELRRRLKVAEDALDSAWMYADKLPHQWPLPERVRTKMKNALAAIRGEGGES